MAKKGSILDYGRIFEKGLPTAKLLFPILIIIAVVLSTASVMIAHYRIEPTALYTLTSGFIIGIIAITIPTLITTLFAKIFLRKMAIKHLLFISFAAGISLSIYMLISSVLYLFFGAAIAIIMIVVGAASIFGWWFMAGEMLFSKSSRSIPLALVQPTLFILFYIPSSSFLFSENIPTNLLLIKLYVGMFIFAIVIYTIMMVFDNPVKKTLKFAGIGSFSAMLQDWLFGISTYKAFNEKNGYNTNIHADVVSFEAGNAIQGLMFIPHIHYGPMGNIGGSNFPYLVEKYANAKYRTETFVMHTAVNEDFNPISSTQISKLKKVIDDSVSNRKAKSTDMQFGYGTYGNSRIVELRFGKTSIISLSRSPKITEDIAPDVAMLFKKLLENSTGNGVILIDQHNSRYERAEESELDGVKMNSEYMNEYMEAMKRIRITHKSKRAKAGFGHTEIYNRLGRPKDLAAGNLNVALFKFNGFSYAILQFNANNMLPSLREEILQYISKEYNITAEVFTTDTHAVNSIAVPASNVLGRATRFKDLKAPIDECIRNAYLNVKDVKIYHSSTEIKNFTIWGYNSRERIFTVLNSVISLSRVLVPMIIATGFIAAAWLIYVI